MLSSAFIAIGIMMLIWLLMRRQWRRQRLARASEEPIARPQHSPISESTRLRGREETTAADLVQLSRRLLAQVEARAANLEELIADADDRIEQLRQIQDAAHQQPPSGDRLDRGGGRVGGGGGEGAGTRGAAPDGHLTADPVTRGVYQLADRGLAPVEIARELDQHLGAVELILALRPK